MFKSSPFAFFWGKSTGTVALKSTAATKKDGPSSSSSPAQAFTISGKGAGLMKVSMIETNPDGNADDGFVDIQCRKLSYAEVASLKTKPKALPAKGRVEMNEFEVVKLEPQQLLSRGANVNSVDQADTLAYSAILDEEMPEKFKTNNHIKKRKNKSKAKKSKKH